MLKNTFFYSLIFLLSLFAFKDVNAQLSKKHFIPPLTYAENGNANPNDQYFYISTPKTENVSFKITKVGSTDDVSGVVSRTSPQIISLQNGEGQLFVDSKLTSIVHNNKGYIIEANDVIYVSVRMNAGGAIGATSGPQAGALVSKGSSALGTTFRAGMYTNENPQDNYLNFISVMATEDNTIVNFDDLPTGILIKNYSGALPISNILLNEGESYVVATNAADNTINRDGLIGTLISSDKPIVVNTGSANGSFHNGGGRDYGIDQIVGLDKIGNEYIFVKGDGSDGWENVLIVAHEDSTTISINGNGITATINKGEYYLIEGDLFNANGNLFVETSKPVFAYQGIGANTSEANQGLFFVPPLSCENRGKVDNIPNIESIGGLIFTGGITVVTNKTATVNINSLPISDFTTSGPFDVDGNTEYVTYKVTNLTGDISIESSGELYCAYFNVNGSASSGSFYSGFPSSPEINFDTTIASLGNCIPNMTLEAANTELFDTFEWYFDDEKGGGFISTGITDTSFKPTTPGKYKLKAIITCTMAEFESIEIPVSICPDDFDGDLIIDNLDVDIDNDGILNCDESFGDATLNIADINNPQIVFQDSSTNNSTTNTYTETETSNSFIGDSNGNFESSITPATDSKLKYELKFNQNINFKITQDISSDHTISDGEYFILKIGPNSKNITLLDPDDQLLIDTNFDGEFESGITNISASEIWFQYKANTSGAASTFQFVANQINQIDFKHQSAGIASSSTFNGTIQLTCYSLDSDGDGIENMFDLDSDNDGIPDISEASSPQIHLSNIDLDLNGLDDAFAGIATNIDTDNDGIPNYTDLDADNDGIYDLVEAGHSESDANNDGILDNANSTSVGLNGLLDALETTADNSILNYTINDTDSDNLFNFLELDADNDDCFDVTEAGFTDINNDGFLDTNPFLVNDKGIILNNTDGYTSPNSDYVTSAPITLNTPFNDVVFCEASTEIITIDSTADGFQWEVSKDNTTWDTILTDAVYDTSTNGSLQITNTLLSYNNYRYRVILSRAGNACPKISNEITLTVNPLPILKNNPELKHCISKNDTNPTVNLTTAENNISEAINATFEYFTDVTAIDKITEVNAYPVAVNTIQSVFVKVTSNDGCSNGITELKIIVGQNDDNDYDEIQPAVCDDFLDANGNDTVDNSDTDNITNFYLDRDAIIAGILPPVNTEVLFFENSDDRNNTLNEIDITNYRNDINKIDITDIPNGKQFPIYYKIISTINNDCQGLGQFYLQINATPTVSSNSISSLEECDSGDIDGNYTNGINKNIDLTQTVNEIFLGTNQDANDFEVTYYTTESAAFSGDTTSTDYISNPTQYTNEVPTGFTIGDTVTQPIFIHVQNKITGCANSHASFNVIIHPTPIITNAIAPLSICDLGTKDGDVRNSLAQNIDISIRDTDILDGKNASDYTITYHKTQTSLQDLTSTGIDKNSYDSDPTRITIHPISKISEETLFIRILNNNTGCTFNQSTVTIIVNPEPTIETISNLSECDNNDDGDDANGIIQTIDLNGKIPEILGASQDPDDFLVTFHSNTTDAATGDNKLNSPYENLTSTETIFVRVQNKVTLCVNDEAVFDIIINPLPDFTITSPQVLCLNDLPLNISVENPINVYSYVWTNENGDTISTADNADVTKAGTYNVIATSTNGSFCERKETLVITESNSATLENSFITIVDESNNIGSKNNLSISIDTITNDLGPGDYQFAILNTDDDTRIPFAGFQDEPLFENLEGGIYQIIVNDKNGCSPDETLLVSVIQFPKFFTPNEDGDNDSWEIKGANKDFYPNSSINIFNRYGKLVAQLEVDDQGWNGTYNGKTLSSDDYWFNITLIPADDTKPTINKTGNFSLIRK